MPDLPTISVHLAPALVPSERLRSGVAVVIDVLRATTTMIHALAAGCEAVRPCATVEEAQNLADGLPAGKVLLGGERQGVSLTGFDLGNSPREYTPARCKGTTLVMTTTNGTRALLHAAQAERTLVAAFVNYSAVCEQLKDEKRPVHVLCAGESGDVALEDTLLAGALVEWLSGRRDVYLDDGARLAWDCFEHYGRHLEEALQLGAGGVRLKALGYDEDVRAAGRIDLFALVPEVRHDPLRVTIGTVGIAASHWPRGLPKNPPTRGQ
jgi:2-phosphosulfolactate phosphatase